MFSQVLSASFNYADIAFLALLLLGLILGLVRGVSKSFKGLFLAVTIILCSLLILGATFNKIRELSVFDSLNSKIVESANGWGEAFTSPLYQNEDGTWYVKVQRDGEMQNVPLSSVDGIKGRLAGFLAQRFVTEEGVSLGSVAADYLTNLVAAVGCFILFCILLGIVAAII